MLLVPCIPGAIIESEPLYYYLSGSHFEQLTKGDHLVFFPSHSGVDLCGNERADRFAGIVDISVNT